MDVRRYIALALVLVAAVAVFAPARRVVVRVIRPRPPAPIIVPPPLTPLQAKHAKHSAAGRSPDSTASVGPARPRANGNGTPSVVTPKPQRRPLPSRKPKTVKTRPHRRAPAQRPPQGSQSPPPAAPPKQCPPVNVTVPAPVTIGAGPLGVNCP